MQFLRCLVGMLLVLALILNAVAVSGQNYPNKPIRMVTNEPGGGNDFVARVVAQGISAGLGQEVIVDNRANVLISAEVVAKALPDGYTLLFSGSSLWVGSLMVNSTPYDPIRDFSPITMTTNSPTILVVQPSLAVTSVKELIALAKAKPGYLNYSSAGSGSTNHLAGELFKAMAGVNIVHDPYKGSGAGINAVLAGEVQLMFPTVPAGMPLVKSGKLRALGVTSAQPSALAPGLPTVAASGLPGYEAGTSHGILAPANTPAFIIKRLNQEMVRFINTPEAKDAFLKAGLEAVGSSPEQLGIAMKSEMTRLGKVINDAGLRTN